MPKPKRWRKVRLTRRPRRYVGEWGPEVLVVRTGGVILPPPDEGDGLWEAQAARGDG